MKYDIIDDAVSPAQINLKSFEYKKKLNETIWVDGLMNPIVQKRLMKIADKFYKTLKLDESIIPSDVIMVGSLASYNWSKYSDIDLHIVVDFSKISDDAELVRNYFTAKKNEWNQTHDKLTIFNYPVETYVQDINEENAAEGVYSIKYNRWIKIPKGGTLHMNKKLIKKTAAKLINTIEYYEDKVNKFDNIDALKLLREKVGLLYDSITDGRKKGLQEEGEGSANNIVFKILRRSEHLKRLRDLRNIIEDKIYSI